MWLRVRGFPWWLIAGLAVAVAGEVVEHVISIAATKKGAGESSECGSCHRLIGGRDHGLFVPPPVVGAILVAMLGSHWAHLLERLVRCPKQQGGSSPAVWAAGGRLAGMFAKIVSSGIVWLLVALDLLLDWICGRAWLSGLLAVCEPEARQFQAGRAQTQSMADRHSTLPRCWQGRGHLRGRDNRSGSESHGTLSAQFLP